MKIQLKALSTACVYCGKFINEYSAMCCGEVFHTEMVYEDNEGQQYFESELEGIEYQITKGEESERTERL